MAWGPNQLEVHVLLSDPVSTRDRTLGPMPTAWPLPSGSSDCPEEESQKGHTQSEERLPMWADWVQIPLPPLSDSLPAPPPFLISRMGLELASTQDSVGNYVRQRTAKYMLLLL